MQMDSTLYSLQATIIFDRYGDAGGVRPEVQYTGTVRKEPPFRVLLGPERWFLCIPLRIERLLGKLVRRVRITVGQRIALYGNWD